MVIREDFRIRSKKPRLDGVGQIVTNLLGSRSANNQESTINQIDEYHHHHAHFTSQHSSNITNEAWLELSDSFSNTNHLKNLHCR